MFDATARRNLLADGVLSRLMDALAGGVFMAGLALAAGASNLQLGLVAALPFAAQAAQWPVARALLRRPRRKGFTVWTALASRTLVLALAVAALAPAAVGLPAGDWAWALVLVLAVSTVLATVSSVAWNWWMRDLVPTAELGRYFGKRMWVAALAGMAATLLVGFAADRAEAGPAIPGTQLASGAASGWPVAAGALLGILGIAFLARVAHPPTAAAAAPLPRLWEGWRPGDARLAAALAVTAAAMGFALPFLAVFLLRSMGLSLLAATAMAAVSQVGYLASLRGWGHLSDRHGHRPVLQVALGMLVTSLLLLGLLPPGPDGLRIALVAVAHFLCGYALGGVDLAGANLALKSAPPDHAPLFLARIGMAKAAAGGLAALAAGALWQAIGTGAAIPDLWPGGARWPIPGFQVLCLGAALLGAASLAAAARLPEAGGKPVRDVAVAMRREVRQISSVAGIRAFVHTVSYIVEALAPPPPGTRRLRRARGGTDGGGGAASAPPSPPR